MKWELSDNVTYEREKRWDVKIRLPVAFIATR